MTSNTLANSNRNTHPFFYMLLIIPFGATGGFIGTTLGYLLSNKGGVSVAAVATLISVTTAPNSFKFLWAPIVDFTLTAKKWYLVSAVFTAIGIYLMGALPAKAESMVMLTILGFATNFANTLMSMSVESLMAYNTPTEDMGRTAGWYQAGNLGGAGLGASLALWIAEHTTHTWLPGATLSVICMACAISLLWTVNPVIEERVHKITTILIEMLKDIWKIISHNAGFLALMICFLPIGSGGASGVFPTINKEWQITDGVLVGTINGLFGGLLSALGSLIGGYICNRLDNKRAYSLFGFMMVACALAMAWAPRTPAMYILFVLIYQFIIGLAYAAFTAVVLEVIGKGAAATKYNVFASLSNIPINYMGYLNGQAYGTCGKDAMLYGACGSIPMFYTDAGFGIAGLILFALLTYIAKRYGARISIVLEKAGNHLHSYGMRFIRHYF